MNKVKERYDETSEERRNNDWLWRFVFTFLGGAASLLVFVTGVSPYILVNHDEYILKNDVARDYVKKEEYDKLKEKLTRLEGEFEKVENVDDASPGNIRESNKDAIINREIKVDYSKLSTIDKLTKNFYENYGDLDIHAISIGGKEAEAENLRRKLAKIEFIRIVALMCEANLQNHYAEFIKDIDYSRYLKMTNNNEIDINRKK